MESGGGREVPGGGAPVSPREATRSDVSPRERSARVRSRVNRSDDPRRRRTADERGNSTGSLSARAPPGPHRTQAICRASRRPRESPSGRRADPRWTSCRALRDRRRLRSARRRREVRRRRRGQGRTNRRWTMMRSMTRWAAGGMHGAGGAGGGGGSRRRLRDGRRGAERESVRGDVCRRRSGGLVQSWAVTISDGGRITSSQLGPRQGIHQRPGQRRRELLVHGER